MSYKATHWAYELPVSGSAKAVLVALADMADEGGTCFPGQDRLSAMTGWSVRTVSRALSELEEMGAISRFRRYGKGGFRTSDRYQLNLLFGADDLPAKLPTGQNAYLPTSAGLPANEGDLTGQNDRAKNHQRTTSEPPVLPSSEDEVRTPYSEIFESWWGHYPRRVAKGDAWKAWESARKAKTLPTVEVLITAAEEYARREPRPEFRKYPAGWLRARMWEDEVSGSGEVDWDAL